jgi:GTP-binding protein
VIRLTAELRCCSFQPSQFPEDKLPQVAFAGRSNVGKSSLINLLAEQSRLARTSNTPGKTRGVNFYLLQRRLYFADLPGYGYSKTGQKIREEWDHLIETYLESRSAKDMVLLVLDCRLPPTPLDLQMRDWLLAHNRAFVVIANKADKLGKSALAKSVATATQEMAGAPVIACSTKSGVGRQEIWRNILGFLKFGDDLCQMK